MDIMIGIAAASLYFILGLGAARLAAKAQQRELRSIDFIAWPIMLFVFGVTGDVA